MNRTQYPAAVQRLREAPTANGPAVERPDGRTEYWIAGRKLTQTEFTQAREPA